MKAATGLIAAGILATAAIAHPAPDHDFNGVVDGLEQHYGISGHRLPMMGLAGFCAGLVTHGGLKGLRIAEFEHVQNARLEGDDISGVIAERLGSEWQPVLKEHQRNGADQTVIFARPNGHALRLLVAEYEHGELNVVRVELDGEELSKWIKHMDNPTKHSRQGEDRPDERAESRAQ